MKRKYIYKSFILLFLCSWMTSLGQVSKERRADRDFEAFAYVNAREIYEAIAEKGYVNTAVLSKLGDAYYFNGMLTDAFTWYDKLFQGSYAGKDLGSVSSEYYYRYAQTLKATGNPEQAEEMLSQFAQREKYDSRSRLFLESKGTLVKGKKTTDYIVSNLSINSAYSEYGATVLDKHLIFTSSRDNEEIEQDVHAWTGEKYTQLYASRKYANGSFGEPVLFSKTLAAKNLNMGTAIFSKDSLTMYFTGNNGVNTKKQKAKYNKQDAAVLKIYRASKKAGQAWGNIVELPFNSEDFNTAHPALTPDERWLYFVSDRKGTMGLSDIYRIPILNNVTGEFGKVEKLGRTLNTEGRESFPFISSENILYFSSDGRPGLGGLDIFKVQLERDGGIGTVQSIGEPINSVMDDFAFYIDEKANRGFFTSNRLDGYGGDDIYEFMEKPCLQNLVGSVTDKDSNEGIQGASVIVYDAKHSVVNSLETDEKGNFKVAELLCNQKYYVRAGKENYVIKEVIIQTDNKPAFVLDIQLESNVIEVSIGDDLAKKLNLAPIYFDFDSARVEKEAEVELMTLVELMKAHPRLIIEVRAYTDSRGTPLYNKQLSEHRVEAVIQWMVNKGISINRLSGKGYGDTQLLNACTQEVQCSEEEHQLNRRSEFVVVEF